MQPGLVPSQGRTPGDREPVKLRLACSATVTWLIRSYQIRFIRSSDNSLISTLEFISLQNPLRVVDAPINKSSPTLTMRDSPLTSLERHYTASDRPFGAHLCRQSRPSPPSLLVRIFFPLVSGIDVVLYRPV